MTLVLEISDKDFFKAIIVSILYEVRTNTPEMKAMIKIFSK